MSGAFSTHYFLDNVFEWKRDQGERQLVRRKALDKSHNLEPDAGLPGLDHKFL